MPPQTIENRVERLEQQVTELEKLPERVTAMGLQIVQLGTGIHEEFSAVRAEMRARHEDVVERLAAVERGLREEIPAWIDETRTHMRVLHEDVIARLAAIQEGQPPKRPARSARPKKR